METGKNKVPFFPVPTALGKLDQNVEFSTVTTAPRAGYISKRNQ
jgi:hypothetical protein